MTEDKLEQLVPLLLNSSWSTDLIITITGIFEKQTTEIIGTFVITSYKSLLNIEHWAWQMLRNASRTWTNLNDCVQFFHVLYSFNMMLVYNKNEIPSSTIISLLIPSNIDDIDDVLEQVKSSNDDVFVTLAGLWLDIMTHSARQISEIICLPVSKHLNSRLYHDFIMTDEYKFYLKQLREPISSQAFFTSKQIFYVNICSFSMDVYLSSKSQNLPYIYEDIVKLFCNDYAQIILTHSYSMDTWSKELLSSIARIIGLIGGLCWCVEEKSEYVELFLPSKDTILEHIYALIRFISYQPFYKRMSANIYNDETILIDGSLGFLLALVKAYDLGCFVRSETNVVPILSSISGTAPYDRIRISAYGLLADILSDKELKELKLGNNMCNFFFDVLEQAWQHPTKKWKHIAIPYLLKGFLNLSSNDAIQTSPVACQKLPLLIELCDQYPMAFDVIWALSFNPNVSQKLKSNQSFITKVVEIKSQTNDEHICKTMNGILWNLETTHEEHIMSDSSQKEKFDIMISYSHSDKTICKKLYEELIQVGYRVWIDFDQMHGNVMDAMAGAIEQSRSIMICMSEQYRRSNYCRAEAQYAFQKQLHMIPILLQKHYKPDCWLGFLIGSVLYVDFTKYEYSQALSMLLKEFKSLDVHKKTMPKSVQPLSNTLESSTVSPSLLEPVIFPDNVQDWTSTHVNAWLIENDLPQMARILSCMDGLDLIYFSEYIIKSEPQKILLLIEQDSLRRINETVSLIELSRLRSLIERKILIMHISTKDCQAAEQKNQNINNSAGCKIL